MAKIKPFKGLRPQADQAREVASRPYDVLNSEEARLEAKDHPNSFLYVVKPEIDLPPDTNPYDPSVYEQGKNYFDRMIREGVFTQDQNDSYYIYQLIMGEHRQTGLVACAHIDDYFNNVIKKHELTRPDKEQDRINHIKFTRMQAEPVFFAYPSYPQLDQLLSDITNRQAPIYDFVAEDNIQHRFWKVENQDDVHQITTLFGEIPSTYVADGHHRTAASALVGKQLENENPHHQGNEEYNYFLAVHFPHDQLQIIDYNRVVTDLNGMTADAFLEAISNKFQVENHGAEIVKPEKEHQFSLYLEGNWYILNALPDTYDANDPVGVLDVTILSKNILEPFLNIHDLRRDKRIDFVGGIRGLKELKKRVDSGEMKAAFALYPVSMTNLMNIADAGEIMPPKTTWFEPKLRSGLVVHQF